VIAPVLIDSVRPEYPEEARKSKISGHVLFRAVISEYGKVESLELVESDHYLLTKAASDSIRQWRYRPATKEGRPVRVFLTVSTEFHTR
jgi:periplasmic protein TonB